MKKSKDWCRITYLRRTIRDRKTTIVKDKNGKQRGGVTLTDETIKPYLKQLDDLEGKMAETRRQKLSSLLAGRHPRNGSSLSTAVPEHRLCDNLPLATSLTSSPTCTSSLASMAPTASTTLASPAPSPEQIRREALLSRIRAKDAASTL